MGAHKEEKPYICTQTMKTESEEIIDRHLYHDRSSDMNKCVESPT